MKIAEQSTRQLQWCINCATPRLETTPSANPGAEPEMSTLVAINEPRMTPAAASRTDDGRPERLHAHLLFLHHWPLAEHVSRSRAWTPLRLGGMWPCAVCLVWPAVWPRVFLQRLLQMQLGNNALRHSAPDWARSNLCRLCASCMGEADGGFKQIHSLLFGA
jgi:hypothetical protein